MTETAKKHWQINVIRSGDSGVSYSIPESTSEEDVKALLRLLSAQNFTDREIIEAFQSGDCRKSIRFEIQESGPGKKFHTGMDNPSVYAHLEEIPREKH